MAKNKEEYLRDYRDKYKDHLDYIFELSKKYQDKELRTKFYGYKSEIDLLKAKKSEQQVLTTDEEKRLDNLTTQLRQTSSEMLKINKEYHHALNEIVKSGASADIADDTMRIEGRLFRNKIKNTIDKDPENFGSLTDRQESIKYNRRKEIRNTKNLNDNQISNISAERKAELIQYGSSKSSADRISAETKAAKTMEMAYKKYLEAEVSNDRIAELEKELDNLNTQFQKVNEERVKNKAKAQTSGKKVFMPELNEEYYNLDNQISTIKGKIGLDKKNLLENTLPVNEIKAEAQEIVTDISKINKATEAIKAVSPDEILPAKATEANAEKILQSVAKVKVNNNSKNEQPKSAYDSYMVFKGSGLIQSQIDEDKKADNQVKEQTKDYVTWWTNALKEKETEERRIATETMAERKRYEKDYSAWWNTSLKEQENQKIKAEKAANDEIIKAKKLLQQEIKTFEDSGNYSPEWLEKKKQLLKLELDQTKATEAQKQRIILESEKTLSMKLNGSKDRAKYYDTVKFLDKDYYRYRENLIIADVNNTKMTENEKVLYVKAKMAELKREQKNFYSVLGGSLSLGGILPAFGMPLSIMAGVGSTVYGAKKIADRGIETENELKLLQAVGGYNTQDLDKLKEAALSAALAVGAIPAEVLKLEQALSRNGKTVQEITESVASIQNFAKVYQTDFEQTADVASKVSNIFGVTMPRALDVMAVTMRETTINGLDEFSDALSKGSAMADALGYTVEQTMGLIGVAINKGMNAQDASNGMQKLLSQAKDAKGEFARLTGGTAQNFEELTGRIKSLTKAQKENLLVKWQGGNLTEEQAKILVTVILNSIDKVEDLKNKIVESNGTIDRAIGDAMTSTSNMYGLVKNKILNEFTEIYNSIEPGIKGILYITNQLLDTFFKVSNEEKSLNQSFKERILLDANITIVKEYTLAIQNKDKAVLSSVHRKNEYLTALSRLKEEYPDLLKNLDAEKTSYADIARNMEAVQKAFENKIKTELAQSKLKDIIEEQVNYEAEYTRRRQILQQREAKARNTAEGKAPSTETSFSLDKGIHTKTKEEYIKDMMDAQEELKQLEAQYYIKNIRSKQAKQQVKDSYGITDIDLVSTSEKGNGNYKPEDEDLAKKKFKLHLETLKLIADKAKFESDNDQRNFEKKQTYIKANYTYQTELAKQPMVDNSDQNTQAVNNLKNAEAEKLRELKINLSKDLKQNALAQKQADHERLTSYYNYLNAAKSGDENQYFRNIELENTQFQLKLNNLEKERIIKGQAYQNEYNIQKDLETALHEQRINNLKLENDLNNLNKQETTLQTLKIGKYRDYETLKKEISLKGLRERISIPANDPNYTSKYQNSLTSEQFETSSIDAVKKIDQKSIEIKKLEIKREYGQKNYELELEIINKESELRKNQIIINYTQTEEQKSIALLENEKQLTDKTIALNRQKYKAMFDVAKQACDSIKQISNILAQMEIDNINKTYNKKQKILDKDYKDKIKKHQGATRALEKIDKEYEKEREKLEEEKEKKLQKAQQKKQKWSIAEAMINFGLGVTNVWSEHAANPITATILTALLTGVMAANIAQITAQKFSKGVIKLNGAGGTESDSILAKLSAGETVLTARETEDNYSELTHLRNTGRLPESNNHATQLTSQNNKIISLLTQISSHSQKTAIETETNNRILDSKEFKANYNLPLDKVSPEGIYRLNLEGEKQFNKERY